MLLKREGWAVNAKRIYRLYSEEGLIVRTNKRKQKAQRQRVPHGSAVRANQKWSMDFVAQRLADGRWIRVLTVVDQFRRECLALFADVSLSGEKVAAVLDKIIADRGAPQSITVDNGTEFASECLNVEVFFSLADARHKLALWRQDYNHHRPHSSLAFEPQQSLRRPRAAELTRTASAWKTLRVSHIPTARLLRVTR